MDGVPLWNRSLEYSATPKHSFLVQSGLLAKATISDPAEALVKALLRLGVDHDRAEVGASVLCLMLGGLDEAQNLAMPHAWTAPTTYGSQNLRVRCGPRMEGTNRGEAG